jgi:DNA polymerase-3 subunit epsilon
MNSFTLTDRFFAIDVELANPALHSICQIGLAGFDQGQLTTTWSTLVNPEDHFAPINVRIHGISEAMAADAPKMREVAEMLNSMINGFALVSHTSFDINALRLAYDRYGLRWPAVHWIDSARVVRRTWRDLSAKGYGLANTARMLGIEFKHHNALEDARAAGEILLAASRESGLSLRDWIETLQEQEARRSVAARPVTTEPNPDGDWFGEIIVFTGKLAIPRMEAAAIAAGAGCRVDSRVTNQTTLLVVGDQDSSNIGEYQKSAKHIKAEILIGKGHSIRILRESDFKQIAKASGATYAG